MPRGASPERTHPLESGQGKPVDKPVLGTIGPELPDNDTEQEFQANWKITKKEEVSACSANNFHLLLVDSVHSGLMTLRCLGLLYQASICSCYIANLAPLTLPYCIQLRLLGPTPSPQGQ